MLESDEFYCNPKKCAFALEELEFLGYIVTAGMVKTDPAKIATIQNWPEPIFTGVLSRAIAS